MLNHTTQFLYVRMITGPNNYDAMQRCLGDVLISSPLCGFCDFPPRLVHWAYLRHKYRSYELCGRTPALDTLPQQRSLCPLDALAEPQVVYLYLFA